MSGGNSFKRPAVHKCVFCRVDCITRKECQAETNVPEVSRVMARSLAK